MVVLLALLAALHLTAKDNGKSFTVKPQQAIVVTLASNPSTGYHWRYLTSSGGEKVVLLSHSYVASNPGLPGAPGKEIWRFRAIARGDAGIQMRYIRTAQPQKPARRFGVTIRVR